MPDTPPVVYKEIKCQEVLKIGVRWHSAFLLGTFFFNRNLFTGMLAGLTAEKIDLEVGRFVN